MAHPREVQLVLRVGKSCHLPCRCHHCCCGSTRLGVPTLLGAPAELHHLQFFLLSFALLSFGPGLQFVNRVLTSDLLLVVSCSGQ